MSTEEERREQRQHKETLYHPFNALEIQGFPMILWSEIPVNENKEYSFIIQDITKGRKSSYLSRNPLAYVVYDCQLVTMMKNKQHCYDAGSFIELHLPAKSFELAIKEYPNKNWGLLNTKMTSKYPVKIILKRPTKKKITITYMELLKDNKLQRTDFTVNEIKQTNPLNEDSNPYTKIK